MATVGGDWLEIRVTHPTLGTKSLFPKSNESSTMTMGGIYKEDDDNQRTAAGENIYKMVNGRPTIEVVVANDPTVRKEAEFIQAVGASPVEAQFTCQHINGSIYSGNGTVVNSLGVDVSAATFSLKIVISGNKWNKIA